MGWLQQEDFTGRSFLFRLFHPPSARVESSASGLMLRGVDRLGPDDLIAGPGLKPNNATPWMRVAFLTRRVALTYPPHRGAVAVRFAARPVAGVIDRPPRRPERVGAASVSPKATILIVDDEPDVREVLLEYFVAHGYAVMGAESASVAKTMAAQHSIDLALVDIHMPGEDGLSLARHLRERYAKVAIVMLTSAAMVVDRIVGLEMGADDYVPKPFDPRELLARVKSVLRRTSSAGRAELGAARVRIGRCVL